MLVVHSLWTRSCSLALDTLHVNSFFTSHLKDETLEKCFKSANPRQKILNVHPRNMKFDLKCRWFYLFFFSPVLEKEKRKSKKGKKLTFWCFWFILSQRMTKIYLIFCFRKFLRLVFSVCRGFYEEKANKLLSKPI